MFPFLNQYSVPFRKIFWVGMVMAIFNPPAVGIVFSLFFMFQKETRRGALIIAAWSIIWMIIFSTIISILVSQGDVRINPSIL